MRLQEKFLKALIFFVKKGLSQCPYSDQGMAMELAWPSIAFLLSPCWRFSVHSLHVCAVLTTHALCFHGVRTALTAC